MAPLNLTPLNTPEALQTSLVEIVEKAQGLAIPPVQAVYDLRQLESLFHDAQHLHEEANNVFERMQHGQGLQIGGFGDFFGAPTSQPQGLDETTFAVHGQEAITQIADVAEDLHVEMIHSDPPMLIAQCAKIKGIVIKTCVNIERQVIVDGPHKLAKYLDEQSAVAIRAAYGSCRWQLRHLDPQDDLEPTMLKEAVHTIALALHTLRQHEIFHKMYYRDRLKVVDLLQRATMLRDMPLAEEDCKTLLAQTVQFRDGLAQINHRQEIVEHDTALLNTTLDQWEVRDQDALLDHDDWMAVKPLWGLHEQLDEWIQTTPSRHVGLVVQILKSSLDAMK